jgi:hypothetical protein
MIKSTDEQIKQLWDKKTLYLNIHNDLMLHVHALDQIITYHEHQQEVAGPEYKIYFFNITRFYKRLYYFAYAQVQEWKEDYDQLENEFQNLIIK